MNKRKGLFVTFEGPNGVGKSTLMDEVVAQLRKKKLKTLKTKEPTQSSLGQFIRSAEELYQGRPLACLVAADRYFHLENEILPALDNGKVVISDRYVESSLVLQRFDGLKIEDIWTLNQKICVPDLSIILTASPETLNQRLKDRVRKSRFERTESRAQELRYYLEAGEFLKQQGFNVIFIENDSILIEENVGFIVQQILSLMQS